MASLAISEKIQSMINSHVGEVVSMANFKIIDPKNKTIQTYVYNMHKNNILERVDRGTYKIVKEIKDIRLVRYPPNKLKKTKTTPSLNKRASQKHKELIEEGLFLDHYTSGKSMIENMFYSTYSHFNGSEGSDAICITGPNVKRHIQNLVLNIAKNKGKIILVDMDPFIMKEYYDIISSSKLDSDIISRLSFYHGDIQNFKFYDVPFQDLDLMCTWETILPLVKERFSNQILETKTRFNSFIFTVTEGGQKSISYNSLSTLLKDIFNIEISKVDRRYVPIEKNYLEVWENFTFTKNVGFRIVKAFRYKSEAKPMFTVHFIYDSDEVKKKIL